MKKSFPSLYPFLCLVITGSSSLMKTPLFPLKNPGIVSIPLGFLGAFLGALVGRRETDAEAKFAELSVRANTGLGAEKPTPH